MYHLLYDTVTGKCNGIMREDGVSLPFDVGNRFYQEFLSWNFKQVTPLDLKSTIQVVTPEPPRDLAKEIDELKAEVAKFKKAKLEK